MLKVCDIYYSIKDTPEWGKGTEKIVKSYDETLKKIKGLDRGMYNGIKKELYISINGPHFTKEMLEDAYKNMVNDNGTAVPKWKVEDTNVVARQNGVAFLNFNQYDWNYVMNMFYSDYSKILNDNVSNYVNMSKKFLEDKDGPTGKALLYYLAMQK